MTSAPHDQGAHLSARPVSAWRVPHEWLSRFKRVLERLLPTPTGRLLPFGGLLFVLGLTGILSACQTSECYVNADCGTGTCCQGACQTATPIPIGPSSCVEGCQCETWLDGSAERAQCLFFDKTQTTQCTRACASDTDCVTASGLQGRCLSRDEVVTADRLCVWEAP